MEGTKVVFDANVVLANVREVLSVLRVQASAGRSAMPSIINNCNLLQSELLTKLANLQVEKGPLVASFDDRSRQVSTEQVAETAVLKPVKSKLLN